MANEHPHASRAGIRGQYDVNKAGIIMSPGKYEGDPVFAPYFAFTASYGEELSHMEEGCGVYASLCKVDDDDRAEFPELGADDLYVMVTENDQGFVTVNVIKSEAEADQLRETFAQTGEEESENEECG